MDDEAILSELKEIKFHLSLLTHELRSRAFNLFEKELLRTDRRISMFRAFDGARTPAEIGEIAGVTAQGVRDLIRDLEGRGVISVHRDTRGAQIASINVDAILDWCLESEESLATLSTPAVESESEPRST